MNPSLFRLNSFNRLSTRFIIGLLITLPAATLVGCGDDNNSDTHVDKSAPSIMSQAHLLSDPIVTQTFTNTELKQAAIDAGLATALDADPVCGIMVYQVNHTTTGLRGEATNATGAVMRPIGEAHECQGARPVTLYAHGTTPYQNYNLAALNDPENPAYAAALLIAANFAGRGDIVVAPNYPGYDDSALDYAPYVTKQQAQQMLDGLQAGRLTIDWLNGLYNTGDKATSPKVRTEEDKASPIPYVTEISDKLFITGYSQGGYVALATAQALDALGMPATAISPASGPYALTAFADSIMSGETIYGGTVFLPMLTNSYKQEYTAQYPAITENLFSEAYTGAEEIFPTRDNIVSIFFGGKLPLTQLFEATPEGYPQLDGLSPPNPKYQFGFSSSSYLFATDFRAKYVEDMRRNPDTIYPTFMPQTAQNLPTSGLAVRQAFIDNDLRAYNPASPTLLCGGHQDPTVTFDVNTEAQTRLWQNQTQVNFATLDVDTSAPAVDTTMGAPLTPYVSRLDTNINRPLEQAGTNIQQQFATALETMLENSYQVAYAKAIDQGKNEEAAKTAGMAERTQTLRSNYHGMVAPYCLSAANTFFDQYR